MIAFFKRNRILVGVILGVGLALSLPNTDMHDMDPFFAKLCPYINNWCSYIQDVIYGGIVGIMVAAKTENDEQAIRRMALGAFIGGVIGCLLVLSIAAPLNKLAWWFWNGALIGLAYRWAFKGALIGMILGLFVVIASLFREGLIGRNLAEVIIALVVSPIIVAHFVATLAAGFWLLFGETPSSSPKKPSRSAES